MRVAIRGSFERIFFFFGGGWGLGVGGLRRVVGGWVETKKTAGHRQTKLLQTVGFRSRRLKVFVSQTLCTG